MKTLAETLNSLTWGGNDYPGYAGEMKGGPGAAEKAAAANTAEDRRLREAQMGKMDTDLSDVEGPDVMQTGMYKRLYGAATDETARAYDDVRSARTRQAARAGFGYSQPIVQGDTDTINAMQANELGNLPRDIADQVEGYRMQAAGMRSNAAGMYSGSAGNNQQIWSNAENQRMARRGGLWSKLAKVGLTAASFIPGVGPAAQVAMRTTAGAF